MPRVVRPAIDIVLYKDVIIISEVAHRIEIRDSIVASIPACHAGDRGSIPRRGACFWLFCFLVRWNNNASRLRDDNDKMPF